MHILIADPRHPFRQETATVLREMGYLVTEAATAADARRCMDEADLPVDIVLLSFAGEAGGNAEEGAEAFIRHARQRKERVYFLFSSSKDDLAHVEDAVTRGDIDDYIPEPLDASALRIRIQALVRLVRAERMERMSKTDIAAVVRRQTDGMRRTQNEIVSRMFNALESLGEETDMHVRRVGWISAYLAIMLGWSQDDVDALKVAAALHDVGKLGIPDAVLRKPGSLSRTEFALVMQHAAIGSRILAGSGDPVGRMAERIAMYHHEHWDGTGYPDGLAGEAIPLEARITAIADMYDALMSERIYRLSVTAEEAVRMVVECSGTKFDPALCKLFQENHDGIRRYCAEEEVYLARRNFSPTE